MPRSFGLRLEQIQRDFLWGGRALERKPHLVSWSIVCLDKSKGGLGVKTLYKALYLGMQGVFPTSVIWNSWVLLRVVFLVWEATWRKILTLVHIQRRRWFLANRCFLCLNKEESIDQSLFHCDRTRVLWYLLFLVCHGYSPPQLERLCEDGLFFSWVRKGKRHGRLLFYAFFGLFGRKEIVEPLTMRGGQFKGWNSTSFVIFGPGPSYIWSLILFPL